MEKQQMKFIERWFGQLNKKVDQKFNEVDKRSENRYTALLTVCTNIRKDMDKRFNAVDKRFEGIDKRFESVDRRFDDIDKRFADIDKRFEDIDKRFADIDKRFEQMDAKFEGKFSDLEKKIEAYQAAVMEIFADIREEIASLKHRLSESDEKYAEYTARLLAVELALKELERRFEEKFVHLWGFLKNVPVVGDEGWIWLGTKGSRLIFVCIVGACGLTSES